MKPELQIKALAELDGYVWSRDEQGCWAWHNRVTGHYICKTLFAAEFEEPDYEGWIDFRDYRSYDAIIPLIQKQSPEIRAEMFERTNGRVTIMVTPAQLCEALLRATGEWKD